MAAECEVGVMENLGVRRPVVGSIAWLGVDVAVGQWWSKGLPRTTSLPNRRGRTNPSEIKRGTDMTTTAPDLWKKREHKGGAARRESEAEMPCRDRAAEHKRLGAPRSRRSQEGDKLARTAAANRKQEKASLSDERTKTPNENKMSHHWRERAWQREVRLESWKTWAYAGQWLAPSLG